MALTDATIEAEWAAAHEVYPFLDRSRRKRLLSRLHDHAVAGYLERRDPHGDSPAAYRLTDKAVEAIMEADPGY